MDTTVILIAVIVLVAIGVPALVIGRFSYNSRRRQARAEVADTGDIAVKPRSLGDRLAATRTALGGRLASLVGRAEIDDIFWSGIEEALIAADVGVPVATEVVATARQHRPADAAAARQLVADELIASFETAERHLAPLGADPMTMVVVGVNGSGKTTTIAKLAQRYRDLGASAVLGAADTFRAGATQQLEAWGRDLGVEVVSGSEGSDPAAVAHDAVATAKALRADVVIIDTAGRLHSDTNLMQELSKVVRIVEREAGRIEEVLLVLDGTGGQNSIAQAKTFTDAVGVTGIIITKLDGTARGGMAVAVERELGVPIKLIGVGEDADDLIPFDPTQFIRALLEVPDA